MGYVLLERAARNGQLPFIAEWTTCPEVSATPLTVREVMSFSVEERKSSKFTVGLPLILSWHQFPEMGAKSTLCGLPPHHGSARLGQRGGLSAATTVSPPREAAVEPHGDLSPGDVNRALNLSVPKRLTFGFCLVASLWGKFSEPIDSLFVFKPV